MFASNSTRRMARVAKQMVHNFSAVKQTPSLFNKVAVMGGGNMAEAIIAAVKASEKQKMEDLVVVDISKARLKYLSNKYGVSTTQNANEAVEGADMMIVAVKPQHVAQLAASITVPITGVVTSVVAGCTVSILQQQFKTEKVVRCMPNTPASVLEGMTVWYSTTAVEESITDRVQVVFEAMGEQARVTDETFMDMATAVSGSGPAYVFITMEAMIDAACHVGFPRHMARKLVLQTIKGSAIFAEQALKENQELATLRHNVTSPGGTTASALYELEKGGFRTVVADAIWAAYRRSLELGGSNSNVGPGRSM